MVEAPLHFVKPREPKPEWLKVRAPGSENYLRLRGIMRDLKLNTVCEDAHCPNIGECWHHGTATFMILGDICTRACAYCAVAHGRPATLDIDEPRRVGEAVEKMALEYAVITSVDRDDLPTAAPASSRRPSATSSARMPDVPRRSADPRLQGRRAPLETVLAARPDVLNHNTETVPRLYRRSAPAGVFAHARTARSLAHLAPEIPTKTGMMMGLGEEQDEVVEVFRDLREVGVSILTLGQYLRPSENHAVDDALLPSG